jgi:hypothetical protein
LWSSPRQADELVYPHSSVFLRRLSAHRFADHHQPHPSPMANHYPLHLGLYRCHYQQDHEDELSLNSALHLGLSPNYA